MAILWSDIIIHDLISQIEHFCYWNFSANFVRQYYKMIWANFCWQLYIMGKIDIMKGVSESFTVLQGTKIHEKGNWKISEFLFLCEVRQESILSWNTEIVIKKLIASSQTLFLMIFPSLIEILKLFIHLLQVVSEFLKALTAL